MKITSMCTLCSVFEGLKLAWVGPMLLTVTGILAVLSMFAWPLLIIWPVMLVIGIALAAGPGACSCDVPPRWRSVRR